MSPSIQNILNQLELKDSESLVLFQKQGWNTLISKETEYKFEVIQPTAFYVFNKQPYILFFDLTENKNPEREREIYKQVWSFDQAPVIFIVKGNEIQAFNAFELDKSGILKGINKDEAIKECSFWNLQSGATLEWFYTKYQKDLTKKRVNQRLFDNIKQTISWLEREKLDSQIAKILVLRLIFVRYLIDRNIRIDNQYIVGNTILEKRKSFSELLKNPLKLKSFFDYLNERFNGVLFKEKNELIDQNQADILSTLFDPASQNTLFEGTEYWFNLYDFGIIPVELISGIYETLLDPITKDATSAVYTPPFLVDYILTQTVDKHLQNNTTECKIFDPAMGSGIFLVQAFRRMVDAEVGLNKKSRITKARLAEIAQNNLFGIDVNEEAIKVACFSIYVALLDYLEPADIDDIDHRFPTLKDTNFFRSNFFIRTIRNNDSEFTKTELNDFSTKLEKIKRNKFDFILGNAPWDRSNEDYHTGWLTENKIYKEKVDGEKEIALSYLIRVGDFMSENTVCALVVTSTIFYNVSETIRYVKAKFFNFNSVLSILDLSPVRRLVFNGEKIVDKIDKKTNEIKKVKEKISSPALVISFKKYNKEFSDKNPILFQSIKRNKFFNKLSKNLIIEKFDQKQILQKHFLENNWMFKVALYGNTLDYLFLKKLEQTNTKLIDLVDGKTIFKGAGIHKGAKEKYKAFPSILNKKIIENAEIELFYSKAKTLKYIKEEDIYIKSGREEGLYVGTQILIKEQTKDETQITISLTDSEYVFRSGVSCISSQNELFIKLLYSILLSDLYTYYIYSTSGSWGTSTRPQIRLDEEYLSFPYKEPSDSQKEILIALVNKLLQPYEDFYASYPDSTYSGEPNPKILNEINEIIYEIYDVRPYERDLIDYVLNVSRYQFQDSKQDLVSKFSNIVGNIRNQKQVLEQYINVFLEDLTQIYFDEYIEIDVYQLDHFIALNFIFDESKTAKPFVNWNTKEKTEKDFFKKMSTLTISNLTSATDLESNLFIQKDIKGFEENSFYIIKPNEYKCWHRAMARYDVSEIKEAIQAAELGRIKSRSLHE